MHTVLLHFISFVDVYNIQPFMQHLMISQGHKLIFNIITRQFYCWHILHKLNTCFDQDLTCDIRRQSQ